MKREKRTSEKVEIPLTYDTILFDKIPAGLPELVEEAEKKFKVTIICKGKRLIPNMQLTIKGPTSKVMAFCRAYHKV